MKILTWKNGDKGYTVKDAIDTNFTNVSKYTSNEVRTMTTEERLLMPSEFYKKDSKVFDTTLNKWFRYDGNKWVEDSFSENVSTKKYIMNFLTSGWENNQISIPYDIHQVENPIVQLFLLHNSYYYPTLDGVNINEYNDVTLITDRPFAGKVVIM